MRLTSIANVSKLSALAVLSILLTVATATPSLARSCFAWRHPRRAEVLRRDANIDRTIDRDRGHLHGNYGRLEREDAMIRRQEQRDARMNGGYITRAEDRRLNREENSLNRQIRRDYRR